MRRKVKNELVKLLFLVPTLSFFCFALVVPFALGLEISFTDWNGISSEMSYVGLNNYKNIFSNADILGPIRNTLLYTAMSTVLGIATSLVFALAINRSFGGRSFARTAFFLPSAISTVLAVFIWGFIYRDVFKSLFSVGSLLGNRSTVLIGIVIIKLWIDVGVSMMVFLSALTAVPRELYESASLDGASTFGQFLHVTVPMIVPAFTTNVTLAITHGLMEFALPYAATQGGPARASETVTIYIYNHLMSYKKAGYGQAIAVVFTIALLAISAVISGALRKKEVEL